MVRVHSLVPPLKEKKKTGHQLFKTRSLWQVANLPAQCGAFSCCIPFMAAFHVSAKLHITSALALRDKYIFIWWHKQYQASKQEYNIGSYSFIFQISIKCLLVLRPGRRRHEQSWCGVRETVESSFSSFRTAIATVNQIYKSIIRMLMNTVRKKASHILYQHIRLWEIQKKFRRVKSKVMKKLLFFDKISIKIQLRYNMMHHLFIKW